MDDRTGAAESFGRVGEAGTSRRRAHPGRPPIPERRGQIVQAARDLFVQRGYENVSVSDVASMLGMSGSSVYRHLASKQEMLADAVEEALASVEGAVVGAGSVEALCGDLADVVLAQPHLWLLLRRESRHLTGLTRERFVGRYQGLIEATAATLANERSDLSPDQVVLRARCVLACMASPQQMVDVRTLTSQAIAETAMTVARGRDRDGAAVTRTDLSAATRPISGSRVDELLAAAEGLLSRRGYAAVTLEQLGEAAGMSGPSLYHHFENKSVILLTLVRRTAIDMEQRRVDSLRVGGDAKAILSALARSYLLFAIAHADLFRILVNDAVSIPQDAAIQLEGLRRRHVETWVVMSEALTDGSGAAERAGAALSIIDELAATHSSAWLVPNAGPILAAVQDALSL